MCNIKIIFSHCQCYNYFPNVKNNHTQISFQNSLLSLTESFYKNACFVLLFPRPLITWYEQQITAKSPVGRKKTKTYQKKKKKVYVLVKHSITVKIAYFI